METHFRNYQINHKFQEKDSGYLLLLEIEKKENKTLKFFSETTRVD